MLKTVIFALIVWSNGQSDAFEIGSKEECIALTAKLAPFVESADCASFADYSASDISAPELELEYFPPEE